MNAKKIANSNIFSNIIVVVILINAALIGVQATIQSSIVDTIQHLILGVFIMEIFVRWFGKETAKEYFRNSWNWFDIIIVLIALIPPSIFDDAAAISALRVLRVFRVLRIFKAFPELQLMIRVLLRSFKSVYYAGLLLMIFMYIYAIIGVTLFKGETTVVTAHTETLDPFGNIVEAFFSLFRVSTGEDWTDLRYDLLNIDVEISPIVINVYFLSWYVMSAFLLINIVFGAIITNYEAIYSEEKQIKADDDENKLVDRIDRLNTKLDELLEERNNS